MDEDHEVSSVSIGGGGEDPGKGEEVDIVGVNAADVDVVTLWCVVSSSSPT